MVDKLIEVLKDHLVRLATEQFMEWLVKELSWAAWGPVNAFFRFFVSKVVVIVLEKTELGARLIAIHVDAYMDSKKVKDIVDEINETKKEPDNDQRLKELDDELAKAGRELIRYGSL